jgi:hypothetical protein
MGTFLGFQAGLGPPRKRVPNDLAIIEPKTGGMHYYAYQLQADIMTPVRVLAQMALATVSGRRLANAWGAALEA